MYVIVVPSTLSLGVVESQVLGMATGLHSKADSVVLFLGKGADERKEVCSRLYPQVKFLANASSLLSNRKKITGIYSRSVFNYLKVYFLRLFFLQNAVLHYDFRALISEESYLKYNKKLRFWLFRSLELFALRTANKVFTVSNNLNGFLCSNLGCKREVIVTPCCIDYSEIRRKTKLYKYRLLY
nr:hypothetical protein [uncultured Glaciecola sp.]